jgi:hypothetical protein
VSVSHFALLLWAITSSFELPATHRFGFWLFVFYFLAIIRASKTMSSCCEGDFLTSCHPIEQDNAKLLLLLLRR